METLSNGKIKLTAQEVYDWLVERDNIKTMEGQIKFYLGDIDIIVKQRDVVGNIMQEWIQGWLDHNNISYTTNDNMQMPPDFYLDTSDTTKGMLEIKAFRREAGPGFDIADFRMYAEELIEKPYVLDVDYLIFGYDMSDEGVVTVQDVWLKKVWEISRRMENYPINLQVKDNVIHKIRPGVWYSKSAVDYAIFESKEDFICAFEETVFKDPRLRETMASTWMSKFTTAYKTFYHDELSIPRWSDIKNKYDLKTVRKRERAAEALNKAREAYEKANQAVAKKMRDVEIYSNSPDKQAKAIAALDKARATLQKKEEMLQKRQAELDKLN